MPVIETPLGFMRASFVKGKLARLLFCGETDDLAVAPEDREALRKTIRFLDGYFSGTRVAYPPLQPEGTQFQKNVWKILLEVEYGTTASYGGITRRYCERHDQDRLCARAVAHAIAMNALQIIIPCHRIILADGRTGNYAGGAERKKSLLEHEKNTVVQALNPNSMPVSCGRSPLLL